MIDLWAEKPEFPQWRTPYSTTFKHYNEILEWKKKEDAWLEKLKVEHDLLKEHSGRWLHFVAVDYPEIKESITPQKLMELKEKAEMTTVAFRTRDAAISRALKAEDCLEAVKTWLIKAKAEGRISMNVGFSLGLVLGVEK